MADTPFKLIIPVSPHVRKYLASPAVFGAFTFKLTRDHFLGRILFVMLEKPPLKLRREPMPKWYVTAKIPPKWDNQFTKIYLSPSLAKEFDAIVDQVIKDEVIKLIESSSYKYVTKLQFLEDICTKYGFTDDDITVESLWKQYQRKGHLHKIYVGKPVTGFSTQMSSQSNLTVL